MNGKGRTDVKSQHLVGDASPESLLRLRAKVHQAILQELDGRTVRPDSEWVADRVRNLIGPIAASEGVVPTPRVRHQVITDVIHEIFGYGPLQSLLDDPSVTEIIVNGPRCIMVERDGRFELTDKAFGDDRHVMRILQQILSAVGRRIDESSPMVDARLPDGSRVNAVIPPVAITGPALTIRKFGKVALTKEDLLARGTVTPEILAFLEACVKARLNIIVSGGTSSGKTTTLNVLASFIDPGERVITIEDTAELQMNLINRVGMESRPPNVEGQGEVTIRDMVRNALRMRPDRIIVGEVRGGEALDMLQAMLTGHQGSLSTVHSNSPRDTLHRMETMVMMAGLDLPSRSIQRQIASAIDLIIHQSRFQDGSRKITHITEIMGLDEEQIVLQDIFTFEQLVDKSGAVRGRYVPTGVVPRCINKMKFYNIELPDLSIFRPQKD